jgi:protein-L-isoaspartate(D-aspartate) O-methyltransferase
LDVSSYAIDNAKADIKNFLLEGSTSKIPFENNYFDLVVSLNTLYNLYCFNLKGSQ